MQTLIVVGLLMKLLLAPVGEIFDFRPDPDGTDFFECRVIAVTNESLLISVEIHPRIKRFTLLTFPTHFRLRNGMWNLYEKEPWAYRITDVKAGDLIALRHRVIDKIDYAIAIKIWIRDFGPIPASPLAKKDDWKAHHQRMYSSWASSHNGWEQPSYLDTHAVRTDYPAYDPRIEETKRLKRFPRHGAFSYVEYALFMR